MGSFWIVLIPEDPRFVPDADRQRRARERFAQIAPEAREVQAETSATIEFHDCGGNFERVRCPSCHPELSIDWWLERVNEDWADGFKLAKLATPCCGTQVTLHDLSYDWPQGFGRFSLHAMNAGIGRLKDTYHREFEDILGTKLPVIHRHI